MLLEVADKKRRTNMREGAVNYPRKSASAKDTSERHVSTTRSGLRVLQHSKSCRCVNDGDTASEPGLRKHKVRLDDLQLPQISTSDSTTNGNIFAPQDKTFNINKELDRRVPEYEDVNMNVPRGDSWSCPRICIDTTKENHQLVTVDNNSLAVSPVDCPVIRLSLRKPRDWKWKLTTSASSPAIVLPVIRLMDEHGDVLVDTGEKCESSKNFDSNGNNEVYRSGLTHKNRSKPPENKKHKQRINEAAADGDVLGNNSEQKRKAKWLRNLSQEEGQRFMIAERCDTQEMGEAKRNCCKNRKTQCLHTSLRLESGQSSHSDGCVASSRCKDTSRNTARRRVLGRRRNQTHSSTSSDSSPEVRRRTLRRSRARGRTACCTVA